MWLRKASNLWERPAGHIELGGGRGRRTGGMILPTKKRRKKERSEFLKDE